ncbi:MAG: transposase, partial [Alteromonas sp.]|nr:transposase [Alteromonas sp.]
MRCSTSSIEHAREWTLEFVVWYNTAHKHSALKFVTPEQRHTGADSDILSQRK